MFRNSNSEARFSNGPSSTSSSQLQVASVAFDGQESSWIGLLSRPALSLLRRFRLWGPAPAEISNSFISEENYILRQLNEMMPLTPPSAHHLTYTRCNYDRVPGVGPLELGTGGPVPWMTAGIDHSQQPQVGHIFSIRNCINKVLMNPQGVQLSEGGPLAPVSPPVWSSSGGKVAGMRWGSPVQREESSETCLLSEVTETDRLCSPSVAQTKAPPTDTIPVLASVLPENAGPTCLDDRVAPHRVQNKAGFTEDERGSREAGLPLPEQDNGYSSLEEELSQRVLLSQLRASGKEGNQLDPSIPPMQEIPEQPEPEEVVSTPHCQNKNIAFIMGCPCSDDDSSQSESDSESDGDDDDGFDSEGSSDLSESSNEDEDDEASDSDSEPDSESERLWTSLCQSLDPYNPRNFTAHLHTGPSPSAASTLPRSVPTPSPSSTPQPPPASSSPPISASPPSSQDTWDDSTSASEVDEAESLRLLSSFSCSTDPYSPLNFKAPLRTQGPTGPTSKTRNRTNAPPQTPPQALRHNTASPPEYRKEGAEERLDSGFSETSTARRSCKISKKVRFSDDVEEFFTSCEEEEEDRRGPWEELARDRCRFLRRCQEVEQSIGFCLQPQHRRQVLQRLNALSNT